MQLPLAKRKKMFDQSRAISSALGSLFQNPYNLKLVDVDMELKELEKVVAKIEQYKNDLMQIRTAIEKITDESSS